MGIAHRLWRQVVQPGDPRDAREIHGDIDDELVFHLEQRERELVAGGLTPQEARAEALRRFGNVANIRAACRRVQTGGMIMLQRVTLILVVVLLGTVAWLARESLASQRAAQSEIEALHANMQRMMVELEKRGDQPLGLNLGSFAPRVLQLPATAPKYAQEQTSSAVWLERMRQARDPGSDQPNPFVLLATECTVHRQGEVLPELWPQLNPAERRTLGDAFCATGPQSHMLSVAYLFATDPSEELARYGLDMVRKLLLVDFSLEQRAEFSAWYEENCEGDGDGNFETILAKTAPALVARLKLAPSWDAECERFAELSFSNEDGTVTYTQSAEALFDAGGLDVVERWAVDSNPKAQVAAMNWVTGFYVDEVTLRKLVVGMVGSKGPREAGFLPTLCTLLAEKGNVWGSELLLSELDLALASSPRNWKDIEALVKALSRDYSTEIAARVLARMFSVDTPEFTQLCNRAILPAVANIEADPRHDLEWWKSWWSIYHDQYPNAECDPRSGLPLVR